ANSVTCRCFNSNLRSSTNIRRIGRSRRLLDRRKSSGDALSADVRLMVHWHLSTIVLSQRLDAFTTVGMGGSTSSPQAAECAEWAARQAHRKRASKAPALDRANFCRSTTTPAGKVDVCKSSILARNLVSRRPTHGWAGDKNDL